MTVTNAQRLAESAAEQKLKETQFEYIREVLLRLPTDCDITHWLQVNAVNDLDTLLGLSHTLIATMTHRVPDPDDTTKKISVTLKAGEQGLLQSLVWYAYHLQKTVYVQDGEDIPWSDITPKQFGFFRRNGYFVYSNRNPADLPSAKPAHQHADEELKSFQKGVKRDSSAYPVLKDEKQWDEWYRTVIAEANAQLVGDVLNPAYTPGPASLCSLSSTVL
jgi:hypothetical protein